MRLRRLLGGPSAEEVRRIFELMETTRGLTSDDKEAMAKLMVAARERMNANLINPHSQEAAPQEPLVPPLSPRVWLRDASSLMQNTGARVSTKWIRQFFLQLRNKIESMMK